MVQGLAESAGPLSLHELTAIALEILEGLTQLHAANILHLDLKPGNILLDEYGHAYVADFGISYALRTMEACTPCTSISGTPHYMYVHWSVHSKLGLSEFTCFLCNASRL